MISALIAPTVTYRETTSARHKPPSLEDKLSGGTFDPALDALRTDGQATTLWRNQQIPNPEALYQILRSSRRPISHPLYGECAQEVVGTVAREALLTLHDKNMLPPGVSVRLLAIHEETNLTDTTKKHSYATPVTENLSENYLRILKNKSNTPPPVVWIDIDTKHFSINDESVSPIVRLLRYALGTSATSGSLSPAALSPSINSTEFDLREKGKGYRGVELPTESDENPSKLPVRAMTRFIFADGDHSLISVHEGENLTLQRARTLMKTEADAQLDITSPLCLVTYSINCLLEQAWSGIALAVQQIDKEWNPMQLRTSLYTHEVDRARKIQLRALQIKHRYEDIFKELSAEVDRIKREELFSAGDETKHISTAQSAVARVQESINAICRRIDEIEERTKRELDRFQKEREAQQKTNLQLAITASPFLFSQFIADKPQVSLGYLVAGTLLGIAWRAVQYFRAGHPPLFFNRDKKNE